MLRFASLGSGSGGNGLVVESCTGLFTTRVLVDNGFNLRQLQQRLARAGLELHDIDAVLVTHEHSDHVGGVAALAARCGVPVHCSRGTAQAAALTTCGWQPLQAGARVEIGMLSVAPYAVPHDAAEPLQFVFSDGDRRLGLLTDAGEPTDGIARALAGVHALILECNHDAAMLAAGAYPPFLKARIAGAHGHLSNRQAAQLLHGLDHSRLRTVVAAHLSERNNTPRLARAALAAALDCSDDDVHVADQQAGLAWITV